MSQAGDIITGVKALVQSDLTSTFHELSRAYDIETLPATDLDNGFTVKFGEDPAGEQLNKIVGQLVITRVISVIIIYRTFATAVDDKTKAVEQTIHDNEETVMQTLRRAKIASTTGQIRELVSANVEEFAASGDAYLKNELKFNVFYRVTT